MLQFHLALRRQVEQMRGRFPGGAEDEAGLLELRDTGINVQIAVETAERLVQPDVLPEVERGKAVMAEAGPNSNSIRRLPKWTTQPWPRKW